jgi:NADH-quinone oxidoreductase subunit H
MVLITMDIWLLVEKLVLIMLVVTVSLVIAMYTTYAERKVAAFLQDRRGPNRAGPFGILQPLADGGKLFFKEEIIPLASSKVLFVLGPCLAMMTALMTSAVIPWGGTLHWFDRSIDLQIADVNIGVLYIFGVV